MHMWRTRAYLIEENNKIEVEKERKTKRRIRISLSVYGVYLLDPLMQCILNNGGKFSLEL